MKDEGNPQGQTRFLIDLPLVYAFLSSFAALANLRVLRVPLLARKNGGMEMPPKHNNIT